MPGLGGYGYLPEFLQQPQGRSFDSFLNPRGNRSYSAPSENTRFQPFSNGGNTGDVLRYAKPLRIAPLNTNIDLYLPNTESSRSVVETGVSSSMEAGALSLTSQATELVIRTLDGDLVTIHIGEKEQSAAYLTVENRENDKTDDVQGTEVAFQNAKAESSSFDLKAVFQGDEVSDVSIEANSESLEYTNLHMQSKNENGQTDVQYRSVDATSSHLSFQVEGSLDQEELEAIGSLLKDVDALADEFFDGDVQKAFYQASQLGYDDSEIAGYALKLTEQETNIIADRYQRNSGETGLPSSLAKPIAAYTDRLKRIQDTANLYFEMKVLEVMMDRISDTRERDSLDEKEGVEASGRFRAFNERILDAMLEWMA